MKETSVIRVLPALGCGLLAFAASAVEINVASVTDLRAAIADTVNVPDGSTIVLQASPTHYDVSADGLGPIRLTRSLTLRGSTENPRDTVLTGNGMTNILYVGGTDTLACNLTVTNGLSYLVDSRKWYRGGGIHVNGSSAVVSNCVVTGCHFDTRTDYLTGTAVAEMTAFGGAGVYANGSSLVLDTLIENCWIFNDRKQKVTGAGAGLFIGGKAWGTDTPSRAYRCEVRNCSTETMSVGGGTGALVGGGLYVSDAGIVDNCRVHHNWVRPTDDSSRCYGGGLYVGTGGIVSNSLVYLNTCQKCVTNTSGNASGGGVAIEGAGLFCTSTVSNNYSYGDAGGVFHINYPSGGLRDSLIIDNEAVGSGGAGTGGPAATGCVFHRNTSGGGGGGWLTGGSAGWFSNCVFEANATGKWGEGKAARVQRGGSTPFVFESCWFVNHTVTDGKAVLQFDGSPLPTYRAHIRNCVFVGNTGSCPFYSSYTATGPEIDNCTFVASDTEYYAIGAGSKRETNVVVRNTLFHGYKNGGLPPAFATDKPEHVSNCYDQVATTLPKDGDGNILNGNLAGTIVGEPGFRNLAETNLTLRGASPLRGKGLVLDWMKTQDGSADWTACDAGAGTYMIEKVADYGVAVRFGRRYPRYTGGADAPDIGAFEHYGTADVMYIK